MSLRCNALFLGVFASLALLRCPFRSLAQSRSKWYTGGWKREKGVSRSKLD